MTTFPVGAIACAKETLMRRVQYSVAMSLDGYSAGPKGEADWITTDPEFDFTAPHHSDAIVSDGQRDTLAALKAAPGEDIWLFDGGALFCSLADNGLVDAFEVGIVPIAVGAGVPLLPSQAKQIKLSVAAHKVRKTDMVSLQYAITKTFAVLQNA